MSAQSSAFDYGKLPPHWARIIIDGDSGSGKTTLAKDIAGVLRANVVSLDDLLLENDDTYWNRIAYEPLKSAIVAGGPRVIIEGVCILKVFDKMGIAFDYHIFRTLYNGAFGWVYEDYLAGRGKPPTYKLTREILQYYREYRPFDVCHCLFPLYRTADSD